MKAFITSYADALCARFVGGGGGEGGMNALRSRFVGVGIECVEVSFRGWGE